MKIYYFNSSHWDREWYQTFQQFRYYLVTLGKNILDCLENDPEFKVFNFDGQSVVLEDIFEIKPEWRERFEKLIKAERLNIGPWYVQPDEFLVSGEALIHNLLIGHELAEAFGGKAWKVGYLCDIFGHIAQMPQILSGFDIDNALIWRGAPNDISTYFNWSAPDGTSCAAVKMPRFQGYGDFAGNVVGFWDIPLEEDEFKVKARKYIDECLRKTSSSLLLLFDGVDHAPIHKAIPQYIKWIKELYPDADVEFSNVLDLLAEVKASGSLKDTVCGELATTTKESGGFQHLISHTLSSYYPLKQANDECQNLLELLVSPFVAMEADNTVNDLDFLKQAWKLLIQNQAHDSICGCSIDQVHKDMEYRFDQVKAIADALVSEFIVRDRNRYTGGDILTECHHISGGLTHVEPNGKNGKLAVRFYNPLPYERTEVMDFEIVFPSDYSETYAEPFGYETINSFNLIDQTGNIIPYNITGIKRNHTKRFYRFDARQYNCYNISAEISLAPAGWTTLAVEPSKKAVRNFASQVIGHLQAENSCLKLKINRDGSFDVTDKASGRKYRNLNNFVADGEIGDGWNHVAPKGNSTVLTGGNAIIKLIEDSSARTVFEIVQDMVLPEEVIYAGTLNENYAGILQSDKEICLKIKTRITLDAGSALLKLNTEIDNNAKDYRLRLLLPTGISGNYFVHQAFCFLDRAPGRASGNTTADWKEPEQLEKNFNGIVGKRDGNGGIAFFSRAGLHEVGSLDNENGDLYITFLRAFRRTVATNGETRCQLQHKMSWNYGLYFIGELAGNGSIYEQYQKYRTPLVNYTAHYNDEYDFCSDKSRIKLEAENICMSIIKSAKESDSEELILRLVNLGNKTESAVIKTFKDIKDCKLINMEEKTLNQVKTENCKAKFFLKAAEIKTFKINFQS